MLLLLSLFLVMTIRYRLPILLAINFDHITIKSSADVIAITEALSILLSKAWRVRTRRRTNYVACVIYHAIQCQLDLFTPLNDI